MMLYTLKRLRAELTLDKDNSAKHGLLEIYHRHLQKTAHKHLDPDTP
jgi:hypothetical protein